MSNAIDPSFSIGAEFYTLLESIDPNNDQVDDAVQTYLDKNPTGLSFTYKGREYVLVKNGESGIVQLHEIRNGELILRDPVVQINSKHTPDGSIEIGGLVEAGSRIYIMRSGDNNEEIVAFGSADGWTVDQNYDKAVVLYSGKREEDREAVENEVVQPPVADGPSPELNTGEEVTVEPGQPLIVEEQTTLRERLYINAAKLPDGEYVSKDFLLLDSAGQVLGKSWYDEGTYKVQGGIVYSQFATGEGGALYLPVDEFSAGYSVGTSYMAPNGELSTSPTSYEFLRGLGISTDDIDLPYVFLGSDPEHFSMGQFNVISAEDCSYTTLITRGTGADQVVIGRNASLDAGSYVVQKNSAGNQVLYKEHVENTTRYLIPVSRYTGDYIADSSVLNWVDGKWVALVGSLPGFLISA